MKCYKFEITAATDFMSAIHGCGVTQSRLYIPNKGVIGYRDKIDFFSNDEDGLREAEKMIKGEYIKDASIGPNPNPRDVVEVNIPDENIDQFIESYNNREKAEEELQKKGRNLISLL